MAPQMTVDEEKTKIRKDSRCRIFRKKVVSGRQIPTVREQLSTIHAAEITGAIAIGSAIGSADKHRKTAIPPTHNIHLHF